mmetsp:Transcript_17862/g.24977  ORF Transcript_17862/g.24977 Transcript_17862/m.24977 type:complete len:125 (+) Transcript_17862:1542-1916(+)
MKKKSLKKSIQILNEIIVNRFNLSNRKNSKKKNYAISSQLKKSNSCFPKKSSLVFLKAIKNMVNQLKTHHHKISEKSILDAYYIDNVTVDRGKKFLRKIYRAYGRANNIIHQQCSITFFIKAYK